MFEIYNSNRVWKKVKETFRVHMGVYRIVQISVSEVLLWHKIHFEVLLRNYSLFSYFICTHWVCPWRDGQVEVIWITGYILKWFTHPQKFPIPLLIGPDITTKWRCHWHFALVKLHAFVTFMTCALILVETSALYKSFTYLLLLQYVKHACYEICWTN